MNYVQVESSQIAEVGFGDGVYGPETLGIKFPPTKKQLAAGEPGSEYHYQNVSGRTHQALMAAKSIGSYFGQNIKAHPEQYPFVKVEAENPTQPPSSPNGGGGVSQSATSKTSAPVEIGESLTDSPAPVTSLAVIDTLDNTALFASGGVTDAQLAAGREWYLAEAKKYGIETEEKRTALKRFARPLQKLRTGIEARAKEFTGETKRKLAVIDTEKRRLVLLVGGIEDEVLRPLTEWEAEEDARKTRLASTVTRLSQYGQMPWEDFASLESIIAELEAFDLSTMQEYKVGAESAIAASLRVLKPELARRMQAEKDAAELATLRRKQAEREEADRLEEARRNEEARIAEEAAKLAAKQVETAVEQARQETRQEVIAELTGGIEEAPVTGSHSPAAVEAAHQYAAIEVIPTRQQVVNAEVVEALMGCALTRHEAVTVLNAIAVYRIPHVTITY